MLKKLKKMKESLHFGLLFLLFFLLTQPVVSQEIVKKGIHQLQKEEFGIIEVIENKFDVHKIKIIPLQKNNLVKNSFWFFALLGI